MKKTDYNTSIYKADHTRFGGLIYPSDFYTDYRGKDYANDSVIARRIAYDAKFDSQCRMNAMFRRSLHKQKPLAATIHEKEAQDNA